MCGDAALSSLPSSLVVRLLLSLFSLECFDQSRLPDTPWDEPTKHSPEFYRYIKGTIFDEDPWNRISDEALCMLSTPCLFVEHGKMDGADEDATTALLKGMLEVNPIDRMTLEDVSQHPWCMRCVALSFHKLFPFTFLAV
jgi:hypothetical protein